MNCYNQYLEMYKKMMDRKTNWIQYMEKKKRMLFYSFPYIVGVCCIGVYIGVYMYWNNLIAVGLTTMIGVALIFATGIPIGKMIEKEKNRIALQQYKYSTWNDKYQADREEVKKKLKVKGIKKSIQINYLIQDIERSEEKSKLSMKLIGGSVAVLYLIPIWKEFLGVLFKQADFEQAALLLGVCSFMVILMWFVIDTVYRAVRDIYETRMLMIYQMKSVLIEMYIDAVGKEQN